MKQNNLHSNIPPKSNLKASFKVPENYFEQNAVVLKKISQSNQETKVIKLKTFIPWLSSAAAIALVIWGTFGIKQSQSVDFSNDDLMYFMEIGYVDFSDEVLVDEVDFTDDDWLSVSADDAQNYLEQSDLYYLEENIIYESY